MNPPDPSDRSKEWAKNRREINLRTRELRSVLAEIARLMQRVVMKGTSDQRAELKSIFQDTKQRILELVNRIDKS
jgi:hypothetical protein